MEEIIEVAKCVRWSVLVEMQEGKMGNLVEKTNLKEDGEPLMDRAEVYRENKMKKNTEGFERGISKKKKKTKKKYRERERAQIKKPKQSSLRGGSVSNREKQGKGRAERKRK